MVEETNAGKSVASVSSEELASNRREMWRRMWRIYFLVLPVTLLLGVFLSVLIGDYIPLIVIAGMELLLGVMYRVLSVLSVRGVLDDNKTGNSNSKDE